MRKVSLVLCLGIFAVTARAQRTWDTIPVLPEHYVQKVAEFKKEVIVKDMVLFLGNSITEGGNWKKLLGDSSVINRGISGDITFGVLKRLDDVGKRQPSKVFLLIGVNDISKGIPDETIIENIFSIVKQLKRSSSKTQVFVQSILPVNSSMKNFPAKYNKGDHIVTINGQLQKYGARLGYTFVDLYAGFAGADGKMEAAYSTDGLHLSAAGYQNWIKILKKQEYLK